MMLLGYFEQLVLVKQNEESDEELILSSVVGAFGRQ